MFNAYLNVATETQAIEAVRLARKHEARNSSAKSCADDAQGFLDEGRFGFAHEWALESLAHSVGIFHADHASVKAVSR